MAAGAAKPKAMDAAGPGAVVTPMTPSSVASLSAVFKKLAGSVVPSSVTV